MSTERLRVGAATDVGRIRTENEDDFVANTNVFAVADGMGGHQAGEVASAMACTTLRERLAEGAINLGVVVASVVEANAAIFQAAHNNVEQRGMGTTLTALVLVPADEGHPDRLALINVGDSRTYVMRGDRLRRVTVDHSYVQELVSTGHITEAEARHHPRRNIVTRALGIEPTVQVDTWMLPLMRGDRFILCSDGLVDEVDDDEISQLSLDNPDPQAAAEAMVAAANDNGGRDNVTVVVVDILEGDEPVDPTQELRLQPSWDNDEDDDPGAHRLIEADAPMPAPTATDPSATSQYFHYTKKPRFTLGMLLFILALATILTIAITLAAVAINNDDGDEPVPTSTTSTSVPTTVETSTTTRPSTTTTTDAVTTVP